MALLYGKYSVSLDPKGRMAIPTLHRNLFPEDQRDTIIITRGSSNYISGYYKSSWDEFIEKIMSFKTSFNNRQRLKRQFIGRCHFIKFDKLGRITLPADLIEYAKLEGSSEAFVIGCDDAIEIWNPKIYKTDSDESEEFVQGVLNEILMD